ncbi:MauE/DoxX family redox-associated membrane protein [Ornithinimicrobium cavernae]|uniref:MauE/DoxX family redox-associated membrane protein n=1 Tax=Ornithinimicrobium cavernae TaxID=2666047 RepID=UPI000D68BB91|nr:MauE/DoxX family redox-associated membrane protein [Ornithinimicrobium cavernae]
MTRGRWADLLGLVCRLALGGVLLVAGLLKVGDPTGSIQSVVAYRLFDYRVSEMIGLMLPVVEIALGLLLIVGLLTRWSAAVGAVLMLVFIAGIASAWARGLSIDCGCFGTGGPVDPSDTAYLTEILRDAALFAAGAWLVVRPRSLLAVDTVLFRRPPAAGSAAPESRHTAPSVPKGAS